MANNLSNLIVDNVQTSGGNSINFDDQYENGSPAIINLEKRLIGKITYPVDGSTLSVSDILPPGAAVFRGPNGLYKSLITPISTGGAVTAVDFDALTLSVGADTYTLQQYRLIEIPDNTVSLIAFKEFGDTDDEAAAKAYAVCPNVVCTYPATFDSPIPVPRGGSFIGMGHGIDDYQITINHAGPILKDDGSNNFFRKVIGCSFYAATDYMESEGLVLDAYCHFQGIRMSGFKREVVAVHSKASMSDFYLQTGGRAITLGDETWNGSGGFVDSKTFSDGWIQYCQTGITNNNGKCTNIKFDNVFMQFNVVNIAGSNLAAYNFNNCWCEHAGVGVINSDGSFDIDTTISEDIADSTINSDNILSLTVGDISMAPTCGYVVIGGTKDSSGNIEGGEVFFAITQQEESPTTTIRLVSRGLLGTSVASHATGSSFYWLPSYVSRWSASHFHFTDCNFQSLNTYGYSWEGISQWVSYAYGTGNILYTSAIDNFIYYEGDEDPVLLANIKGDCIKGHAEGVVFPRHVMNIDISADWKGNSDHLFFKTDGLTMTGLDTAPVTNDLFTFELPARDTVDTSNILMTTVDVSISTGVYRSTEFVNYVSADTIKIIATKSTQYPDGLVDVFLVNQNYSGNEWNTLPTYSATITGNTVTVSQTCRPSSSADIHEGFFTVKADLSYGAQNQFGAELSLFEEKA